MKAKFINEIQNFKRGEDPYNKLGIGETHKIFKKTESSYYREYYSDEDWIKMIELLISKGFNKSEIVWILLSKHVRWSTDSFDDPNQPEDGYSDDEFDPRYSFQSFEPYIERNIQGRNNIRKDLEEFADDVYMNETQSFKRGEDPYKKLGIDEFQLHQLKIKTLADFMDWSGGEGPEYNIWDSDAEEDEDIPKVWFYIEDMKGRVPDEYLEEMQEFIEKLHDGELDENDYL